jgi:acyl-CoA reductase-like NAD-dependent aldehyde dehydrogenase
MIENHTVTTGPAVIEPMIGGRISSSEDRSVLVSVLGTPLADIGIAPRLQAQAAVNEIRRHADGLPPASSVFTDAAHLFANATLNGQTIEDYTARATLSTGLTRATVRQAVVDLVAEIEALPETTAAELPETNFGKGFRTRWVPCGRVFTGLMASNHPVPNVTWVQALFHGYSVLIRPGSRDPFTPMRLIVALLTAGVPATKIAFMPCSHAVGEFLMRQADRGIVYGGEQAVRKWQQDKTVAVRGPGSTKCLLDMEPDDRIMDHLVSSASFDGGTRCTNLSAVLTSQPVAKVADVLAQRLSTLPVLPADDPAATLLVVDAKRAKQLQQQTAELKAELTDHSVRHDGNDPVVRLEDGSFLMRPLVLSTDRADHPAVGTELPFPFVIVAPWSDGDGIAPLRLSLVLNLLTDRTDIVDLAVREPTVRKVTRGTVLPWTAVAGIPHDGNYTQFLLEPKGIVDHNDIASKLGTMQ